MRNVQNRRSAWVSAVFAVAALSATAHADDQYDCVLGPTSILSYNFTASAPTTGNLRGNSTGTPATRTKRPPANIISCGSLTPTQNDLVPFTGTGRISGMGTQIRPTGTFRLGINTATNQATLYAASFDLLGTSTASAGALLDNFSVPAFCAINPNCQIGIPLTIDLPLGDATINDVLAELEAGPYTGALIPNGPNQYTIAINATFAVTPSVEFLGSPFNTGTQSVPVLMTGPITIDGSTITVTTGLNFEFMQTENTPVVLPDSPFSVTGIGICEGLNLLLAATITSSQASFETEGTARATGTLVVTCPCDLDGNQNIDLADLVAFLSDWQPIIGISGPNLPGDYNGDQTVDLADLVAFLECWQGPAPGC